MIEMVKTSGDMMIEIMKTSEGKIIKVIKSKWEYNDQDYEMHDSVKWLKWWIYPWIWWLRWLRH